MSASFDFAYATLRTNGGLRLRYAQENGGLRYTTFRTNGDGGVRV